MKNNNFDFIICSGILIALVRLLLSHSIDPNVILIFMAAVNYIAIFLVLFDIRQNILQYCIDKIEKAGCSTHTKAKMQRALKNFSIIFIIAYLLLGIMYIVFFKTTDLNDFISIIALAFSIASQKFTDSMKYSIFQLLVEKYTKTSQN